jgi:hypothetical protein
LTLKAFLSEAMEYVFDLMKPRPNRRLAGENQDAPVRLARIDPPAMQNWEVPHIVGDQGTMLLNGILHLLIVGRVEVPRTGSGLYVKALLAQCLGQAPVNILITVQSRTMSI